jgi:hypothetical protein
MPRAIGGGTTDEVGRAGAAVSGSLVRSPAKGRATIGVAPSGALHNGFCEPELFGGAMSERAQVWSSDWV